jgi:hypothetical protein
MMTVRQRLWYPLATVAEKTTLEFIRYSCDVTVALIMGLRSATIRRFERLKSREQRSTCQKATWCPHKLARIFREADLQGIANGGFKHYFLLANCELLSEDVQLAIRAFRQFRISNPEFESFRLIAAAAVGSMSQKEAEVLGHATNGVENVCCFQLTGGEEEISQLYRSCYAVIATSQHLDGDVVPLEEVGLSKPIITISRAKQDRNSDRDHHGLRCEATLEALALSMTQVARDPASALKIGSWADSNS